MVSDDSAPTEETAGSLANATRRFTTLLAGSTAGRRVGIRLAGFPSEPMVVPGSSGILGSFSILIAVIFYFSESGDRLKQKHYQAWQVINTAQGKGGSGGRIEALQELDRDGVPLVGVDVSGAFLQGIRLPRARLLRVDFNGVDARNGDFQAADFTAANLHSGNFRESNFRDANLQDADLGDADFCSANLSGAVLDGAILDAADLGNADLGRVKWQKIKSLKDANIRQVRNAPEGFIQWATQHGAVTTESLSDCR